MITSFFLCMLLLPAFLIAVSAESDLPMVVDNADLLTISEKSVLQEKAEALRKEYELDVVILTVDSLGGKNAQDYADDYYDQNGYGYGDSYDGVLFLLAMEEREWYISTCGNMIFALTDYGIQQIGETVVWYLSDGDYYGGFNAFLEQLPLYLDAYHAGTPVDGYANYNENYHSGSREEVVYYDQEYTPSFLVSLVIGIAAATVSVLIMRSSMNTKKQQHGASGYLKAGSFRLRVHQDLFLYSNVSKVRRQQNNGGGHGGGSSVHRNSGGRRHGGGGGRF